MIKRLNDISECFAWMNELIGDASFSTPFCDKERIMSVSRKDGSLLFGAYEGESLTGVFCLMVLDGERYIETLFLYTREERAYEELLAFLSKEYPGYEMWFVFNPRNPILRAWLPKKNAFFYEEQRYMEYRGTPEEDAGEVICYDDRYRDEYLRIHSKEGYWDGEKVLERKDEFHIFLCIKDDRPVGYIDLSRGTDTNEIMDIRVLPEYRNRGIGALLLKKAIFVNRDNRLVLTVDTDNAPANHLYEKLGFRELPMNNIITAKLTL